MKESIEITVEKIDQSDVYYSRITTPINFLQEQSQVDDDSNNVTESVTQEAQ